MEHPFQLLMATSIAYLLGSIMGAYWVCRYFQLPDPTEAGSGNPGATNIYRLGGLIPAMLTLFWDAAKGVAAVCIAAMLGLSPYEQGVTAVAAIVGHMLPAFHHFKGGKGVATVLGAGLALAWQTTLALTLVWAAVVYWKRISSLASLTAAVMAPWVAWRLNPEHLALFLILALFILIRHRENIINLAKGKERSL
ncbi:glycerol-3-phosphate 1-O-acyltransferase PlsY [Hahella sp. CR1]|uniref:glycerol-3-phosphate 1-O-acyltransferase PlsY n=1 Tax=Hahella sp. CR1 TaxID=2992807 RepID=UPI002442BC5D|nr:glycerol-3-phosphate 1-O-acyltransferase PlsY [Hahella sp. CR1]MDG9667172.1 glycerol-3-phosphate 1-O-acyltransferase PlsY [Hahella sp. CR1]